MPSPALRFVLCIAVSFLILGTPPSLAQTPPPPLVSAAEIERFVDSLAAEGMAEAHVPGLIVVLVRDGQTLFAKGYGFADVTRRIPMTPATGLRAGSVSKPVSATALMKLVENGKLALDAPIDRYLPDLVRADAYGPASSVAQLLTMTGGYADDVLEVHVPADSACPSLGEFLKRRPPARQIQPGIMSYSSWNLALLGHAMERLEGQPYDRVLSQLVFDPLGMTRSTFAQPPAPPLAANLAIGYFFDRGNFRVVPYDQVPLSPGIGLVTTGEDMGRFMAALMPAGSSPLLNQQSLRGLLTRQAGVHPLLRGRSFGFSETWSGPPGTMYHDGNGIGFGSRMIVVPDQRIGIFVSANHRPLDRSLDETPAFGFVRELAVKLLARVAPGEVPERARMKSLSDAAERLDRYAGQYQTASMPRHNLMKIGKLFDVANVRVNADRTLSIGEVRYAEVAPGSFQNQKYSNVLATFREDGSGTVRYLCFGGTGTYERVPWYGRFDVHAGVGIAVGVLSLFVVILWACGRKASTMALLSALTNLAFLAGFGAYMLFGDFLVLFRAIPPSLRVLELLPWIGAAIAAIVVAKSLSRRRAPQPDAWNRLVPPLTAMASLLVIAQVVYWSWVPW